MSDIPVDRLRTNFFATINARASKLQADGVDIIRLDIGSPDLPPAGHIVQALSESAGLPHVHGYQSHRGMPELRAAWASMYDRVHGVSLDPDGILPLLGSKEGVFHISIAVLNPGDVVLVPDPGYQTYVQGAIFAGAVPVSMPLSLENSYLPDLSSIPMEAVRRTKMMWLNYPHNPTAALANQDFYADALDFCSRHGILLCHDAAYAQITYDGFRASSILELPGADQVSVEFNTLSKSHNMAGWRVGAAMGQQAALSALLKIKSHADSGHFLPVSEAAIQALTGDQTWLLKRNAVYQQRRDLVLSALRNIGLTPADCKATLYVWCPLPEGWDCDSFVLDLLEQARVSIAPGSIFGAGGLGFVRLSLTQPLDRIREAMTRLRNWLGPILRNPAIRVQDPG